MKKLIIVLLLLSGAVLADTGNVSFDPPTEREDNTPLDPAEIAGFRVYDEAGTVIMELLPTQTSFSVPALGQTLFLTTLDTDGRESVFSQPAVLPMGKANPKSPGTIIINIIFGNQ